MRRFIANALPFLILAILLLSLISITEDNQLAGNVIKKIEKEPAIDPTIVQPYLDLLNMPHIKQQVKLTPYETNIFLEEVMDLESGTTRTWDKFKGKTTLSYNNVREIWISRIALIFYHEIHNTFNWKIITYRDEDLKALLGFCAFEQLEYSCSQGFKKNQNGYGFQFVNNDNPLEPEELVKEIFKTYNQPIDEIQTPEQALEVITQWMKDNHWQHAPQGTLTTALNYNHIGKTKKTTSHSNREFLQATFRALNIPTENLFITDKQGAVHGGIIFPSINKGLFSTDDIMAFPNVFLPLKSTLIEKQILRTIEEGSIEQQCSSYGSIRKKLYLEFLQKAIADQELQEKYLCTFYPHKEKGDFFFEKINKFYSECSGSTRNLFEDEEIGFWQEQIDCYF
ncbi:hypothetical protein HYY69_06125 [Candidatus Woesearchaeota archaeon]|nr:hypothetical protein [Candidatus Woesearchaeota archaeon]